jgi:hypothetical protein
MSHATIGVAVVIFRNEDSSVWVVEPERNDEVEDAKEAPSEAHLGIGIHDDSAIDGDGQAFSGPGEGVGQVLSHSVLDLSRSV